MTVEFNQPITKFDIHNVSDFTNFFNGVKLSTEDYDATLVWFEANLQKHFPKGVGYKQKISIDFQESKYSKAIKEKASLQNVFGWKIKDAGRINIE